MRVAFSTTYQRLSSEISQKSEDISSLTVMAGTGSRLLKAADDPLAWSQAVNLRQTIRQIETYQKNLDFAVSWNQTTESALSQTSDLVVRARNLAMQAANGTSTGEALTEELNQIVQQAVSLANTQYQDRYVFSGRLFDTAPYTMTTDPDSGEVLTISTYAGDTERLEVRVGNGEFQTVNLDGVEVFGEDGDTNLLQQLLSLKDAVRDGDYEAIQEGLGVLDTSYKNLEVQISIAGTRQAAFDDKNEIFDSIKLQEQSQLSDAVDADMSEVITQLTQKQTLFQAVLAVTSMVSDLHLTNYL